MISVLSGGQTQDEVGSGIFFFLVQIRGFGSDSRSKSKFRRVTFSSDLMSPLLFLLLLG
jgi:hypothetical protein